ncbi:MAG: stage 0 sporulation family protein [Anaerovorax sp.]
MIKVVGVRFKKAGKVYYFSPDHFEIAKGMNVIVETSRGMEFGTITSEIIEVEEKEIIQPLKSLVRIANDADAVQNKENIARKQRTMEQCQEKINKHKLEMKLIDVEYTFDNSKVIFYFTADGRVDFRELVKDLAGVFKMRIELRQIGVRDEAKMVGGIGTCGKGLCCHTWLPDFEPVSIKMAKVQGLSLNPTKISGICGRLMCCLKYENDIYLELRKGMPESGERVTTQDGVGVVMDSNILENKIKVRLVIDEKTADKPEKLSADIHIYKKEEIKKVDGKNRKNHAIDHIDESLLEEIKDLLKE